MRNGFKIKRWTGSGPLFYSDGTERTDVALDAGEDEPERWVTDATIYIKCVENILGATKSLRIEKSGSSKKKSDRVIKVEATYNAEFWVFVDQPGAADDYDSLEGTDVGHAAWMVAMTPEANDFMKKGLESVGKGDLAKYIGVPVGFAPKDALPYDDLFDPRSKVDGMLRIPDGISPDVCAMYQLFNVQDILAVLEFCKPIGGGHDVLRTV